MFFRAEITEMINDKNVALEQLFNDNIAKLAEKMETIDSKNQESVNNLNLNMEERIESLQGNFVNNIQNLSGQMESESSFNENTKDQINILFSRIDDIHEKLYEFETSKKNNLIFYGIPNEAHEKESKLIMKVRELIKASMKVKYKGEKFNNSFFPNTLKIWNALPRHIKSKNIEEFKECTKNEFKPPRYKHFARGSKLGNTLLTRIRVGRSSLN